MPKALHNKLVKLARKRGLKGDSFSAYVFSTLAKIKKRGKRKRVAKPGK